MEDREELCPYFDTDIENFAVLLKGKSLEILPKYIQCFNKCFIVSDFEYELPIIGKHIMGMEIVHFTNRYHQSSLKKSTYYEYSIKHIQLGQSFRINHYRLIRTYIYHKIKNNILKVHLLPNKLNKFDENLPPEYFYKFPNTGLLAVLYALEIIKPKNLWIFGLDFYSADYLTLQQEGNYSASIKNPELNIEFNSSIRLDMQKQKIDRLDLPGLFNRLVKKNKDINIHIATYYSGLEKSDNLFELL